MAETEKTKGENARMDCIFCKIVAGDIPSKTLYEDDRVLAFYDIEQKAPVHFLVTPRNICRAPRPCRSRTAGLSPTFSR